MKMVTMPVSWQMGRWPSAHMRELMRICAIASLAAWRLLQLIGARQVRDVVHRVVVADVLQSVRHALDEVVLLNGCHVLNPCLLDIDFRMSDILLSLLSPEWLTAS